MGLEGDPLGRNVLGLPVLVSVIVGGHRSNWYIWIYGSIPLSSNSWYLLMKFQCYHLVLFINCGKEVLS